MSKENSGSSEVKSDVKWEYWNKRKRAKFWEAFMLLSGREPDERYKQDIFSETSPLLDFSNLAKKGHPPLIREALTMTNAGIPPNIREEFRLIWVSLQREAQLFYDRLWQEDKPLPYDESVDLKKFFKIALELRGKIPPECQHIDAHNTAGWDSVSLPHVPDALKIIHMALIKAFENGITKTAGLVAILDELDRNGDYFALSNRNRLIPFIKPPDATEDNLLGIGGRKKKNKKNRNPK